MHVQHIYDRPLGSSKFVVPGQLQQLHELYNNRPFTAPFLTFFIIKTQLDLHICLLSYMQNQNL